MPRPVLVLLLLVAGAPLPSLAQFDQYTAPGSLASAQTKTRADQARESSESARWHLGRLALEPSVVVRDVGYFRNALATPDENSQVDDYRATLAAGLSAFQKLGSKSLFSAYVAPEYSWWRDQSELSSLNLNWGAGWFGYFNRLTIGANVGRTKRERPLSDELEAPLTIEQDRREVSAELVLTDAITVFGETTETETRHTTEVQRLIPGLMSQTLDRDSDTTRIGAVLEVRRWRIGAGVESTDIRLLIDPDGRSNSGDSPFALVRYDSESLDLDLSWVDRELEFDNPLLGRESLTDGYARVALDLSEGARISVYGARTLGLSVLATNSYLVNTRGGASLGLDVGRRARLTVFAEQGEADFRGPSLDPRTDDLDALGAQLDWRLTGDLELGLYFRDSTWDSSLDDFDRSQSSFGVNLEIGTDLFPW